ncbi:deoxyribodipyrimidine photo-lyase [Salinihabitans flavidus]|uniref:Deoxyribodipyrimidine photo-lyase n=1 Tax=Salinihabitans flavidus TaxID=569882 RepID=A0A1H8MPD5_9RHOB|nr:deoxyribodipyrimidine photo-lyase [Salinihabitans flavidus]SEO19311.1 deoxyribodipyrimidine photo-lyase [Salinihabitans flavidus]
MTDAPVIHWFRQDLRRADNPALTDAATSGPVVPVYILDDIHPGDWAMGGASRAWLHRSLTALNASLGGRLQVFAGDPETLLPRLARDLGAQGVTWTRAYEPWRTARDSRLKSTLRAQGLTVRSHPGALLWEPMEVAKPDGTPYRVFTPFFRKGCRAAGAPRAPLSVPTITFADVPNDTTLGDLALRPRPRWDRAVLDGWTPGEAGALSRLEAFLDTGLAHYKTGRDFPAKPYVSRLSPHLHFGEISPHQAWHAAGNRAMGANTDHFQSELGWREFSHHLLYHNPDLPGRNLQGKFDAFPWREDAAALAAWQQGRTGVPIVDAGMRELWQTGYMHNRVRMITGSFLVKNLLLHWHHGERWFWDTLLDADLANNSASWQWIAGSGADAAPYFRIFNPVTQGRKFDAAGAYTRRFVPELAELPDKHLFAPWEAPAPVLREAGVRLGESYPAPIVDLRGSRQRALDAFSSISG